MTTILYEHKTKKIAFDSRVTKGGGVIISDNTTKYIKSDVGLWFLCGSLCDKELFISRFGKEQEKIDIDLDCSGLFVRDGEVFAAYMSDGYFCKHKLDSDGCFGSGGMLALSALDHGNTITEAVEYAKTRDAFTGGKVNVYDIEKDEFS